MRVDAYIGIGSNLADPLNQVRKALASLREIPQTALTTVSSLYRTAPIGQPGQDDYINAVAMLQTGLVPESLLDALQTIEREQGRVRDGIRWGPRTLDLDILLYGQQHVDTDRLQIPHPEMLNRAFVLEPLREIVAGDFDLAGQGAIDVLRARLDSSGVERIILDGH